MTDIDTSRENVERIANTADLFAKAMKAWQHKTQKHNQDVRDVLRALRDELDAVAGQRDEARECVGNLLVRFDDVLGAGMHWQGQTPDWFVKAAAISCGTTLTPAPSEWNEAIEAAAQAAEARSKAGREWVRNSLLAEIKRDTAKDIRALKRPEHEGAE